MTLVWFSKPVVEAISLSVFYSCICPFLCSCRNFNSSLCRLWPFLLSYVTREFTRRQREPQNINSFRSWLAKQQLCTCITLFCTFLCELWCSSLEFTSSRKLPTFSKPCRLSELEDVSVNNEYENENDFKPYSYSKSFSQLSMLAMTP